MRSIGLRVLARAALLIGFLRPAEAAAQTVLSPPPAWTAYAEQLQQLLPLWLSDGASESAQRLQTGIATGVADPSQALPSVVVRLWVGPEGVVSRLEVAGELSSQAEADLRASILQRHLSPPPPLLPMPIRLRLSFQAPGTPAEAR